MTFNDNVKHYFHLKGYAIFSKQWAEKMLAVKIYVGGRVIEFLPVSPENVELRHEGEIINLGPRKVITYSHNEKTLFS